ncbi:WG repeat-containing protein [Paenibacillus soyae]|uniref:WG repeat-containing protein n=1 Tax=Paenibacillus soyae TaxID=2969249 RepID=A0A9X2MWY5_9BACL|nr:WG repeat-containing protein [Paenibacillus soyae]MCR2805122.1 WG repeat-containing protein [Paenibacillus soyae]
MKKAVSVCLALILLTALMPAAYAGIGSGTASAKDSKYLPYAEVGPLSEGLAWYYSLGTSADTYGFINAKGKIVIRAQYLDVTSFSEGLAGVYVDGKWGYIDQTGQLVVQPQYELGAAQFKDGLVQVTRNGKWGYIDRTGKEVIPLQYDDANTFGEGLAHVKLNGQYGYINKQGTLVIHPQFEIATAFSDGLAAVRKDGKWGYIDKTGATVIPFNYASALPFHNGLAAIEANGKWGYIDKNDNFVIRPRYEAADSFSEGLAAVQRNGLWGFTDKSGKEVIKPKYSGLYQEFTEGYAIVSKADNNGTEIQGYVNKKGAEVIGFKEGQDGYSGTAFSNGLAVVSDGGQRAYYFVQRPVAKATAKPTSSKVEVDGETVAFEAYNIEGSNYFKLRDLAMVLNETAKTFEIEYDAEKDAIYLTSGKPYTPVSGELSVSPSTAAKSATEAYLSLYVDGQALKLLAYNIGGNNYYKLRDIAQAIDFGVTWDSETKRIGIDTSSAYVPE